MCFQHSIWVFDLHPLWWGVSSVCVIQLVKYFRSSSWAGHKTGNKNGMYRVRTKRTYPWAATVMYPCACFNEQGVADISSLYTCWTKEAWVVPSQYGHARLWRGPPFQINLAWKMPLSTLAWILSWCWFSRNHTLHFLLFFLVCVHTAAFKLSRHTEGNNCHLVGFYSHMNVYKSVWLDKIPHVSWEEIGACSTSDLSLLIGVDQESEVESSPEEEEKCWRLARRQAGEARAKPKLCFLSSLGDKSAVPSITSYTYLQGIASMFMASLTFLLSYR